MSGAGRVPAPPASLDCNIYTLQAGTVIHRIHDKRFGPTDFNPGLGSSRFAPFQIGGTPIPTAYAGTTRDCAIFESIFHDIEPDAPFKSVYWSQLEQLADTELRLERDIPLAALFSADLLKWKVARADLIDTPKSTYAETRAWPPAIHAAKQSPHGMAWTSRKFDEAAALMLFGDRVPAHELTVLRSARVTLDRDTLEAVHALALRAGIDIIR